MEPKLTIVISAHDPSRPVQRAVDSVLACAQAKALVVAHNLEPSALGLQADSRLEIMRVDGGKGFPGVPYNAGCSKVSTPYIGILASDDYFSPGALDALIMRIENDNADCVIVPLHFQGKRNISPLRTFRSRNLSANRDRLFYRTAPLGIFRTEFYKSAVPLEEDLNTGEDMSTSAYLWTQAKRISYYKEDPSYFVTDEAETRASAGNYSLNTAGEGWLRVWKQPFVQNWNKSQKISLSVKLVRTNLLQVLMRNHASISNEDLTWSQNFLALLDTKAPGWQNAFEGTELDIIRAVRGGSIKELQLELSKPSTFKFSLFKAIACHDSLSRWGLEEKLQGYFDALSGRIKLRLSKS